MSMLLARRRRESAHLREIRRDLEAGERLRREHLERAAMTFSENRDDRTVLIMVSSKDIEDPVPKTVTTLLPHSEILEGDQILDCQIVKS